MRDKNTTSGMENLRRKHEGEKQLGEPEDGIFMEQWQIDTGGLWKASETMRRALELEWEDSR